MQKHAKTVSKEAVSQSVAKTKAEMDQTENLNVFNRRSLAWVKRNLPGFNSKMPYARVAAHLAQRLEQLTPAKREGLIARIRAATAPHPLPPRRNAVFTDPELTWARSNLCGFKDDMPLSEVASILHRTMTPMNPPGTRAFVEDVKAGAAPKTPPPASPFTVPELEWAKRNLPGLSIGMTNEHVDDVLRRKLSGLTERERAAFTAHTRKAAMEWMCVKMLSPSMRDRLARITVEVGNPDCACIHVDADSAAAEISTGKARPATVAELENFGLLGTESLAEAEAELRTAGRLLGKLKESLENAISVSACGPDVRPLDDRLALAVRELSTLCRDVRKVVARELNDRRAVTTGFTA